MPDTALTVLSWDDIPYDPVTSDISRKIVTGERGMAARLLLLKGAVVPRHRHESEQITNVLSGALQLVIGDRVFVLRAGDVIVIPSGVEHEAVALEETVAFDIFSPIRHDWLNGTDDYFHRAPPPARD